VDFGLTRDEWTETAVAFAIVVGVVLAAMLVTAVTTRAMHALTKSSEMDLDERLGAAVRRPFILIVGIWGAVIAVQTLSYLGDGQDWIATAGVVLNVLIVTVVVRRVMVILVERQAARPGLVQSRLHPGSVPLIRRGLSILVFAVGFLIILDALGLAISPLLAGLGIGGIAVALALQPLLANVFASSYMLSDSSIRIGDWVEIDGGPTGVVDDIGWRATRIRSFDNNVVIVPNSTLADSKVTNFTLTSLEADARVLLGVAYEEDLGRVEEVCRDELTRLRDEWETSVKDREPTVSFLSFGDSNIDVLLKMRTLTWSDSFGLRHEIVKRIHARFRAEGITINYPARRLMLQQGDVDGLVRPAAPASPTQAEAPTEDNPA